MSDMRVIVVTGLPGSGKTTLARVLAGRYRLPVISKDLIKEPLLDVIGAADAAQSRLLSDASFAALFGVARALRASGTCFVLEGNFRPGEHEVPLGAALHGAPMAQVVCRVPEGERAARLAARANHPSRHAGHRLGEHISAQAPATRGDAFLDLPSMRFVHEGASGHPVLAGLDDWMKLREPSP